MPQNVTQAIVKQAAAWSAVVRRFCRPRVLEAREFFVVDEPSFYETRNSRQFVAFNSMTIQQRSIRTFREVRYRGDEEHRQGRSRERRDACR